jgi:hypothetical protein
MKRGLKRVAESQSDTSVGGSALFSLLPVDVAWYLFGFLSLRDIFSLTACCNSLRKLLLARRSDRVKHSLFPLFHDPLQTCLEHMSLSKLGKRFVHDIADGWSVRCVASCGTSSFAGIKNGPGVVLMWEGENVSSAVNISIGEKKTSVNSLRASNGRLFVGVSKPT